MKEEPPERGTTRTPAATAHRTAPATAPALEGNSTPSGCWPVQPRFHDSAAAAYSAGWAGVTRRASSSARQDHRRRRAPWRSASARTAGAQAAQQWRRRDPSGPHSREAGGGGAASTGVIQRRVRAPTRRDCAAPSSHANSTAAASNTVRKCPPRMVAMRTLCVRGTQTQMMPPGRVCRPGCGMGAVDGPDMRRAEAAWRWHAPPRLMPPPSLGV